MDDKTKKKGIKFKGTRTKSTLIITASLIIFLAAIICQWTVVYTLILAAISAMAVYEVIHAVGGKSKLLIAVSCIVGAFVVIAEGFKIEIPVVGVCLSAYALILISLTVFAYEKITFIHAITAYFASVAIPYAFSCFIKLNNIKDINSRYTRFEGIYLVMLVFACSWLTDSFAFLVGRKFGKHKMSPRISPKKSIEGGVAGVIITALCNVIVLLVFSLMVKHFQNVDAFGASNMKYIYIIPISVVLSLVSMLGDLSASVLKRNVGIKDYSNLLPGHGGIMDRFDSSLFVLPVLYGVFAVISKVMS